MRFIAIFASLFFLNLSLGQNLVVNPGAEQVVGNGWTIVAGNWTQENASTGGITPHSGSRHFAVPGSCPSGTSSPNAEVYQDIDVSSYATSIDAGTAQFNFSGWYATYNNQDYSSIVVEYRDASSAILYTYNSGFLRKPGNVWTQLNDVKTAPIGTRTIRIRLISRCGSTGDNDGYYDDLSLTYTAVVAPISLLNFDVFKTQDGIKAIWTTSHESQNKEFELEKSLNGQDWNLLGKISGATNSNTLQYYEYIDLYPYEGLQYYRLKQIDFDGTITSYDVKSVNGLSSASNHIVYYDNHENIAIKTHNVTQVIVHSYNGTLIDVFNVEKESGDISLNVNQLPKGLLIFTFISDSETKRSKFLNR